MKKFLNPLILTSVFVVLYSSSYAMDRDRRDPRDYDYDVTPPTPTNYKVVIQEKLPKMKKALKKLVKGTSLSKEDGWYEVHECRKKRKLPKDFLGDKSSSKKGTLKKCEELDHDLCSAVWHINHEKKKKKRNYKKTFKKYLGIKKR